MSILLLCKLGIKCTLQLSGKRSMALLSVFLLLLCFRFLLSYRLIVGALELVNVGLLIALLILDLLIVASVLVSDLLACLRLHLFSEGGVALVVFLELLSASFLCIRDFLVVTLFEGG